MDLVEKVNLVVDFDSLSFAFLPKSAVSSIRAAILEMRRSPPPLHEPCSFFHRAFECLFALVVAPEISSRITLRLSEKIRPCSTSALRRSPPPLHNLAPFFAAPSSASLSSPFLNCHPINTCSFRERVARYGAYSDTLTHNAFYNVDVKSNYNYRSWWL